MQDLEGGHTMQESELPADSTNLRWSPDGSALGYLHTKGNARDLYMQPLAGGPPMRMIHFEAEPASITAYAWSNDGKRIAVSRTRFNDRDVVLFSGFR